MPHLWRLVDSGLVAPPESAALDEAIMEAHISGEVPNTLHFYIRSQPTISVGYFQKIAETVNLVECEMRDVAIIRRRSGGSSIYTDSGQLIYGLVLHDSDLPQERADSFRVICQAIADSLGSLGVAAVYRPMNDVEVNGRKISGNAQFRRKGSVLQHGTVIVDTDVSQMDSVLKVRSTSRNGVSRPSDRVTTLSDLLGTVPEMKAVKRSLASAFEHAFDIRFSESSLTPSEETTVRNLVDERYSKREWNFRY